MIYLPVSSLLFLLLLVLVPLLWAALAIDIVRIAATKLGFAPEVAVPLLLAIVLGSTINLPLYRKEAEVELVDDIAALFQRQFWGIPLPRIKRSMVVALNVGGGLIPTLLALYQLQQANAAAILAVTALVTAVSYFAAQVVPGIGIQMNPLLAPLTAAAAALILQDAAPVAVGNPSAVAFAGGILGTLLGADLLHLKDLNYASGGVLSIGGAGVFDGIALCGLIALLLT